MSIHVQSSSGIEYNGPAQIDTGSSYNIMPLSAIPIDQRPWLTPTRHTIYGISSTPTQAAGYFRCQLNFENGFIKDTSFLVIDTNIPVLLGMETLNHSSVQSFTINQNVICFNRKFAENGPIVLQNVPLCLVAQFAESDDGKRKDLHLRDLYPEQAVLLLYCTSNSCVCLRGCYTVR